MILTFTLLDSTISQFNPKNVVIAEQGGTNLNKESLAKTPNIVWTCCLKCEYNSGCLFYHGDHQA